MINHTQNKAKTKQKQEAQQLAALKNRHNKTAVYRKVWNNFNEDTMASI